jgi:SAM-dependent methyltransferase
MLTANVMLTPCDEYIFAADRALRMRSSEAGDLVLWPNPTTRLLQNFSILRHARSMLDLGAGCGILGIMAAAHCDRVVCTDLNPRAEMFTTFNASLNGVSNVESRTGDTFEPVDGETFDLILANPPFFVTPGSENLYCENSMELDGYCRRVVREAPRYLSDGGYFQAIMEWVQVGGQRWTDRLAEWLDGNGCDAWIMRKYIRDCVGYAQERIKDNWPADRHSAKLAEWMEYYRQRGVEEVQGGLLAMRRRDAANWLRIEDTMADPTGPFGDVVEEIFATQDVLATHPADAELLETRPKLAPEARLEQTMEPRDGRWAASATRMLLASSLPAAIPVERDVAQFLIGCDGTRTLGDLSAELASRVGVPVERVEQNCCSIIRRLAQRRFVLVS